MNLHQVLTGACNSGDQCFAVGSVEGIHFTAYAAGCDIVILSSDFERVQIIPGVTRGNIRVACIDCCTDTGKIAASYQGQVYIFEPTPLTTSENRNKLDYKWFQCAVIHTDGMVNCLSWNLDGSQLLTGGNVIQMWQSTKPNMYDPVAMPTPVHFLLGEAGVEQRVRHPHPHRVPPVDGEPPDPGEGETEALVFWKCVWSCRPASCVQHLSFSPDGLLFASAAQDDRLVKVWYEDRKNPRPALAKLHPRFAHVGINRSLLLPGSQFPENYTVQFPGMLRQDSQLSPKKEELHYGFVYLSHPRPVTGISWRKTSKYMPRGAVANMLVTSCRDNICRIWCETILPDDGLIDLEQYDPTSIGNPKYHTHRHKHRFLNRLANIRTSILTRRKQPQKRNPSGGLPQFPSVQSVHEFHKFGIHHTGITPGFHFHLAASINPQTDIPLLPTVGGRSCNDIHLRLLWLNNKELQFTMEAEMLLHEIHKNTAHADDHSSNEDDDDRSVDGEEEDDGQSMEEGSADEADTTGEEHKKHLMKRMSTKSSDSRASEHTPHSAVSGSSDEDTDTSLHDAISIDSLDTKIEALLRDWHQSADMLYAVHPVDGSFLVWLVDWLDEYTPYCFRQAQVSFSSRIPHAFPVPDSRSMSNIIQMYCKYSKMDIKSAMRISESQSTLASLSVSQSGVLNPKLNESMLIPNVLMVSKHDNGTLNSWQVSFAENSKFSTVVSVTHIMRSCGHRFRTNSAACHPVLPLMLTSSHHNVPELDSDNDEIGEDCGVSEAEKQRYNFCSELILWRVVPVGPLSKSGGIVELARIHSSQLAAFSNVAWIPTLLPSTTLGSHSNSPSALFVASDGSSLRMYQAVIDARTLLMDTGLSQKPQSYTRESSGSSGCYTAGSASQTPSSRMFNIISLQSSARPGCIIELDPISEASQDWQQTLLLHVYHEQLITGGQGHHHGAAVSSIEVDLHSVAAFEEQYYLVVLEKGRSSSSMMHMWKVTITSEPDQMEGRVSEEAVASYVADTLLVEEDDDDNDDTFLSQYYHSDAYICGQAAGQKHPGTMKLSFSTIKVCSQTLPLPNGVEVVFATSAAGHLSSSSIYPACLAPYLMATACNDGKVRFWRCDVTDLLSHVVSLQPGPDDLNVMSTSQNYELAIGDGVDESASRTSFTKTCKLNKKYTWAEWQMMMGRQSSSAIQIPGIAMNVSCAYSGRIAVAYRFGSIRAAVENADNKSINLCVAIYECESSGGSEWSLEDTIELKNMRIPDPKSEIDTSMLYGADLSPMGRIPGDELRLLKSPNIPSPTSSLTSSLLMGVPRTTSIPSLSTCYSVRRNIVERGNKDGILTQKHLVQLSWVSTEDGSHILTVGVGTKVFMYSQVSVEIAQVCQREVKGSMSVEEESVSSMMPGQTHPRPMLKKSKTMVVEEEPEEIRWMKLRTVDLTSADGLPPLPMHMCWVRAGILVVGLDNEVHVYSQWKGPECSQTDDNYAVRPSRSSGMHDKRNLTELSLSSLVNGVLSTPKSSSSLLGIKSALKKEPRKKGSLAKSESIASLSLITDCGLFEAAHRANPVLPQYHPKQLMELLNFGKIRRVKAILAHLTRCVAGIDAYHNTHVDELSSQESRTKGFHRQRTFSMSASNPPDLEVEVDYIEISSIPPLPIYALLSADNEHQGLVGDVMASPVHNKPAPNQDYNDLFGHNVHDMSDEFDDPFAPDDGNNMSQTGRVRMPSGGSKSNPHYFGASQAQLLMKHLTYTRLPGLSSLDQMYLMALSDTVANTKTELVERTAAETVKRTVIGDSTQHSAESMDECGLRFLLAMRHHMYLLRTLPPRQRMSLKGQGLKAFNIVWAFHSEATEELLTLIPSMQKSEPRWEELKQFGAGWWIYNTSTLKNCIEKVAKAAFQRNKDPLDAAIFYLALKKKVVLWGLFRSVNDKKMADFFKNNFQEERWRKAALKNAFALLGRQRFMHAAAFFLLAGALNDAVEVCLEKLHDLQLALVICRLYDHEDVVPPSVRKIIFEHILGYDANGFNHSASRAHPDPFLRSMAYWLLKDHANALHTLLHTGIGQSRLIEDNDELDSTSPNVFNFYNYLRTHPLLIRQRLAASAVQESKKSTMILAGFSHTDNAADVDINSVTYIDKITPVERRLFFQTAHMHFKAGCPALALEVLSKLPSVIITEDEDLMGSAEHLTAKNSTCIDTGTISDFDLKPAVTPNGPQKAEDYDWGKPSSKQNAIDDFDWSQPVTSFISGHGEGIDWSKPIMGTTFDHDDLSLDLDLNLENSCNDDNEEVHDKFEVDHSYNSIRSNQLGVPSNNFSTSNGAVVSGHDYGVDHSQQTTVDIMAQQYKFLACLKIIMEELSTLATGFEVDGGQLRYQLYIWLEREVDVLKWLCQYTHQTASTTDTMTDTLTGTGEKTLGPSVSSQNSRVGSSTSSHHETLQHKPTLHEVILAEKIDFEAKMERMSRRRQWLREHQQFLRTLLSYCTLQGSGGGGLASVRMELILLLQELQQVRPQQQLLTPLPFPTTLPLLSASIASSKTVIADPIQHLQGLTQDLLHTLVELTNPPTQSHQLDTIQLLRSLSIALSACIYQCLCDSDSFVVSLAGGARDAAMEGFTSHGVVYQGGYLMSGVQYNRRHSSTDDIINTPPSKWPGVSQLRVLMARDKDEDAPKLPILLCEALIAVYLSLLSHSLSTYDAHAMYRLVSHKFTPHTWAALFGGGIKTLLKVSHGPTKQQLPSDDVSKQRMKLHMKLMGHMSAVGVGGSGGGGGGSQVRKQQQPAPETKKTYKERFMPPELSMVSYFMTKPSRDGTDSGIEYDSDDTLSSSSEEEDDYDDDEDEEAYRSRAAIRLAALHEHHDHTSYSWCLMRYAITKLVTMNIQQFLPTIGIEIQELPVLSPLLHAILRTLEQWQEMLQNKLDLFAGPPEHYIPELYRNEFSDKPFAKYKALLQASNTPFSNKHASLPIRRLWHQLVKHELLQDTFIRYIFKKRRGPDDYVEGMRDTDSDVTTDTTKDPDSVKVVHKEQDIILAFTMSQVNNSCVSLSTQKELVELDISSVLQPPAWLQDETEYDIELMRSPSPFGDSSEFMVVQTPFDRQNPQLVSQYQTQTSTSGTMSHSASTASMSGRGTSVVKGINVAGITNASVTNIIIDRSKRLLKLMVRRPYTSIRRMGAHPQLPHYLTGGADGSVRMWEWGHGHSLTVLRQPGSFPKVTKVLYSAQGNKCCVSDAEGSVCLWQVALGSNFNKPIMSFHCHNKTTSDFTFVGSSSLLATAGHSTENKNVCLWDTLLPRRSRVVHAFTCHEHGSPAIVHAAQHQLLISGGRKGEICIFDVRQRQMRHTFQAHESPIKCLALDPNEEYFATGSAEGDIKVWGLDVHQLVHSFPAEHSKSTFFRNMGSAAGVTQLTIAPNNRLFSCGVDGSMKYRQLPERDSIVHQWPF